MSGPIRVSVNVIGDSPVKVDARVPHRTQKIDVKAPIVQDRAPIYDGPYEIVPTEQEQTLETNGHKMTDNVTVDAIPSDHVGSGVPRNDSSSLSASGKTVSVPAGYYAEDTSKAVDNATWKGGSRYEPTLSLDVDDNGLITGSVNTSSSVQPLSASGYAEKNHNYGITILANATKQLQTVSGSTITPTESQQTAVPAKKYTIGDVKVGAIPSDYVGSGVTRKAAETYTPSSVAQEISAGQYLDGAQTIKGMNVSYDSVNKVLSIS